ncbi:Polyketide cyclase / dehydrase and lipid transport [Aquimarina amphilecti]|uniref:Polyketide cyclase / dehydrase and lipid transport n=1 Tax=Aquimarina amphilecti TaxID=1038014 RepID=A0A1H7J8J3_AQUAM|nr:SRPBCC family protein [Aquimarina amphilecti]SEK70177.1 Polyketide cyclase / dehydrase and lipid transport [Aquimarina amphilecti]
MIILNVNQFTNAPKQLEIRRFINAPIDRVWDVISDHKAMTSWMPMIKDVDLIKADSKGTWEEGCERNCQFGPDLLEEKIVHWDPPYGYAYMISDMHIVKNHLGYFKLIEKMEGTEVVWTQYYDPNGNIIKKWMAKNVMLPSVMKKALKNLQKKTSV